MATKPWDPENKYTAGYLKEYKHWLLNVHYRQHTIGAYIILARREGVQRISELHDTELIELKQVMREIESTLESIEIFKPDRFNYEQLGNELHHLHFHGIPRYSTTRIFDGEEWIDENWGKPPKWPIEDRSDEFVEKIAEVIRPHLS